MSSLPSPSQPAPAKRGRPAWQVVLVVAIPVLIALVVINAVMGDDGGDEADPQDVAACATFRDTAADWRDGTLALGELRGRFQDVHDEADGATGPVARAARALLAAATNNVEAVPDAIAAMDTACDNAA